MNHLGTRILETERLQLRQFELSDAKYMYENWAGDPDVTKFLTWPAHSGMDISKDILKDWISSYNDDKFYQWAIVLKDINEPIGGISVIQQRDDIKAIEIGYCIGKKYWNSGITSEAFKAIIKFFFEEVGVNRIESRHDPRNEASGKVMTKCGLLYEGRARQADINNQGICDFSRYGILAEDYFNTK